MTDFLKYSRIMDLENDTYWKRIKWTDTPPKDRYIKFNNCHWGQLKLFYSELEFFNECVKRGYDLKNSVCVYAGSAPGTHISFLVKLFPEIHWILVDPAKFNISETSHISILTGKPNGFYTDETYKFILNHPFVKNKNKEILFISDIRLSTDEESIFNDMLSQQLWLLQLNAGMSMLKCRFPYTLENDIGFYDFGKIEKYVKFPYSINKVKEYDLEHRDRVWFLKGDIYTQLYPPTTSAESRLIIDRNRDNFMMHAYDIVAYEEKFVYFNKVIRNINDFKYKSSELINNHLYFFSKLYENISEYYLIIDYFKYYKNVPKPTLKNIIIMLLNIHKFHNKLVDDNVDETIYKRTITTCPIRTIMKESKKWDNYPNFRKIFASWYNNNIQSNEDDIIYDFKIIYKRFYSKLLDLTKEYKRFGIIIKDKTQDLLSNDDYKYQYDLIKKDIISMNRYLLQMLEYYNKLGNTFKLVNLKNLTNNIIDKTQQIKI